MKHRKKVMVFGVFDGIHKGHSAFLKQAKALGDYLIAVVAQDHIVEHLKSHLPQQDLQARFEHLRKTDCVDAVIVGDGELGKWDVVDIHRPDIIALGYDQSALKDDLESYFRDKDWRPGIRVMEACEANVYHSSLMGNKNGPLS